MPSYVFKATLRDVANVVGSAVNLGDRRLDDYYLTGDFEPVAPPPD